MSGASWRPAPDHDGRYLQEAGIRSSLCLVSGSYTQNVSSQHSRKLDVLRTASTKGNKAWDTNQPISCAMRPLRKNPKAR